MQAQALYYEQLDSNKVKCTLCPHECVISENNFGICKVRKNIEGILYSMNYFRGSAVSLDPIEKKPLSNYYPGSKILSIGSVGCNMRCPYCQNYDISQTGVDFDNTFLIKKEDIINEAVDMRKNGNIGLAYTYNEPIVWYETVLEIQKQAKENNLKNVLVTNGMINEKPLRELLFYTDAINIDLKSFNEDYYKQVLLGDLETVKNTIKIASGLCHVEITCLIIPGKNDSIDEMREMSKFIAGVDDEITFHITKFFPRYKWNEISPTGEKTLYNLAFEAQKHLKNVILGNI